MVRGGVSTSSACPVPLTPLMSCRIRWVVLELETFFPKSAKHGGSLAFMVLQRRLRELEDSRAPAIDRLILAYDQIYANAMGDPDEIERKAMVKCALKLVLCSFRPLTTLELTFLVKQDLQARAAEMGSNDTLDIFDISDKEILQACSNFIIETPSKIVKLAHLSVRQYFEEAFQDAAKRGREHFVKNEVDEFSVPQQHHQAALSCLCTGGPTLEIADVMDLMFYARKFWSIHARNAATSARLGVSVARVAQLEHNADDSDEDTDDPFDPVAAPASVHLVRLIASKARLDETNLLGDTPLHTAIRDCLEQDVQVLLRVDTLFGRPSSLVELKNGVGQQALHFAASRGYGTIFRILLLAGADIEGKNSLGLTPLHVAVLYGKDDIIKAAIEAGAKLSAHDKTGATPLHVAAFCNPGASRLLIEAGADREAEDGEGYTLDQVEVYGEYWQKKMLQDEHPVPVNNGQERNTVTGLYAFPRDPDMETLLERPRISIETAVDCQYCDVEKWLEGSRRGRTHAHCPSVDLLKESAGSGCPLCREIHKTILALDEKLSILDTGPPDIQIKVSLAIDSVQSSAKRDLLVVLVKGVKCAELEFCISRDGEFDST